MATLPISRSVNVKIDRNDRFSSITGFGIPLFLTTESVADVLDASNLTVVYGSMKEVDVDWDAADEVYIAMQAAFGQDPAPVQVKAGFVPAIASASDWSDALAAIKAVDPDWYWADIIKTERDTAHLSGLVTWFETQRNFAIITTNDVLTEDDTDTTCFAALHKGTVKHTAAFYDLVANVNKYGGFALAARLATFNFDQVNSAYTAKFKGINDLQPLNKGSDVVQAVTGFVPEIGMSTTAGHCANAYVNTRGLNLVVEGSTLTPNTFIDEIHATDWLAARMEEEIFGILNNENRIPFDHRGMETLSDGAKSVMARAFAAGLVAEDLDSNGNYSPAYEVIVPSVFGISDAQRKARVAPAIQVNMRYAGAVHYVTINISVRF